MKNVVQDQEALLKLLPSLMHRLIAAQAQLTSIENHIEVAQDGLLRSTLPSVDGVPQFTPQFTKHSSEFLHSIQTLDATIAAVVESIEQIEMASAQLVVGVRVQLQVMEPEAGLTH